VATGANMRIKEVPEYYKLLSNALYMLYSLRFYTMNTFVASSVGA